MAINWNEFSRQFGESFQRTLEMERQLNQKQEQFNRTMQFENRQLRLYTDIAKERNLIEKEQSLGTMYREGFRPDTETPDIKLFGQGLDFPAPPPPESITQAEMFKEGGNIFERKFIGEGDNKIVTDINLLKGISTKGLGDGEEEEKTPYYDLTKSGDIFNKYQDINRAERDKLTGAYQYMTKEGSGVVLTASQKKELKERTITDLIEATENEARKINSKVPGFYSTYQGLLNMIESPDEIDSKVNEYLGGASAETRDAIKTLLRRRIFR